jgi:flagella basal body P-ring formation protein FlgA
VHFSGLNLDNVNTVQTIIATSPNSKSRISVRVKLLQYFEVLKTTKAISRGESLSDKNVTKQRIATTKSQARNFVAGSIDQLEALRDLPAGTQLKVNMIKPKMMVKRGDPVKLISDSQFIHLEFDCQAMSSGRFEDEVNLKCENLTSRNVKAKVIDHNKARLL